jgi:hypothetical protein
VEPKTLVRAQSLTRLQLHDRALDLAEVLGDELGELHLPQKTNALAVFAVGVG